MARFLPVAPPQLYRGLIEAPITNMSHDIFLLAHEVVDDPTSYAELRHNWDRGYGFSILDNSVIELGGAVDLPMVRAAVEVSQPDVVVLPDVLENGQETRDAVFDAWYDWSGSFGADNLMFVPQGSSLKDWLRCLENVMNKHPDIQWIGIPRNTTGRITETRAKLALTVKQLYPWVKVHLLGFSDDMADDIRATLCSNVWSIDSAVPLRQASQDKPASVVYDPGPRGDWWTTATYNSLHAQNVATFNRWVSGG